VCVCLQPSIKAGSARTKVGCMPCKTGEAAHILGNPDAGGMQLRQLHIVSTQYTNVNVNRTSLLEGVGLPVPKLDMWSSRGSAVMFSAGMRRRVLLWASAHWCLQGRQTTTDLAIHTCRYGQHAGAGRGLMLVKYTGSLSVFSRQQPKWCWVGGGCHFSCGVCWLHSTRQLSECHMQAYSNNQGARSAFAVDSVGCGDQHSTLGVACQGGPAPSP